MGNGVIGTTLVKPTLSQINNKNKTELSDYIIGGVGGMCVGGRSKGFLGI